MKYRFPLLLLLTAGMLLGWFVFTRDARRPAYLGRKEIGSLPGAVMYSEGASRVPELFTEAQNVVVKGKIAQAETIYRKIISLEPDNALGYVGLATCRYYQKDSTGAEHGYQEALRRDLRSTMALVGLGSMASDRGKYGASVDFYQRALAVDVRLADAHLGLALSYDRLEERKQAVEHYVAFLKLAPQSSQVVTVSQRIRALQVKR